MKQVPMNKHTTFVYNDIFKKLDTYDIDDPWNADMCEGIVMQILLNEDQEAYTEESPHQAAIFYAFEYMKEVDFDAIALNLQIDHGFTLDLSQYGYES